MFGDLRLFKILPWPLRRRVSQFLTGPVRLAFWRFQGSQQNQIVLVQAARVKTSPWLMSVMRLGQTSIRILRRLRRVKHGSMALPRENSWISVETALGESSSLACALQSSGPVIVLTGYMNRACFEKLSTGLSFAEPPFVGLCWDVATQAEPAWLSSALRVLLMAPVASSRESVPRVRVAVPSEKESFENWSHRVTLEIASLKVGEPR
jgi:hypothetical protein